MGDATVEVNGVRLWLDLVGPANGSAVILIPGAASQATCWPDELVDPLVAGGHRVLRFDPRDIGRSEWIDFESHPYTVEDQAADVVGLMEVLSIERAHIVGFSGGGIVAQVLALAHAERVLSLTSWASSPASTDRDLPQMKPEILQQVLQTAKTEQERVEQRIAILRAFAGSRLGFDEAQARARVESEMKRGQNPACAHAQVGFAAPPRTDRLRTLAVPTLVLHGDEDPALPLPHGELMASAVPKARLVVLEGIGHELHPAVCTEVVPELMRHFSIAEARP
jgi:pimeloyl-ACP methyl ester carboxylesterase